ncbi:MAG: hypothetical protein LBT90_02375 [Holosporaceae bacterium]|jgi:Na+-driven multidrug efflux pump|nr:hypothetical protein [Holosporaceae bacterium]
MSFGYQTWDLVLFMDCLKIGMPLSLSSCISMVAWYVIQTAVSHSSKDAATVYNIGINIYTFFLFVGEGANKSAAAICANMIGRSDLESIEKTRKIFGTISIVFGGIIAMPLAVWPEWIFWALNLFPDNVSLLHEDIIPNLILDCPNGF